MPKQKLEFEDWFKVVDKEVIRQLGLSAEDLPDASYREMYEDGFSPKAAATRAIKAAKES